MTSGQQMSALGGRGGWFRVVRALLSIATQFLTWSALWIAVALFGRHYVTLGTLESTWGSTLWYVIPIAIVDFPVVLFGGLVYGRSRFPAVPGYLIVLAPSVVTELVFEVVALTRGAAVLTVAGQLTAAAIGISAAFWLLLPRRRASVQEGDVRRA